MATKWDKNFKNQKKAKRKREASSFETKYEVQEEETEWVEASSSQQDTQRKREDWMQNEYFVPTYAKEESHSKRKKLAEKKQIEEKEILKRRELNPYWRDGGIGIPLDSSVTSELRGENSLVGVKGCQRLEQVYESQLKDHHETVEDVCSDGYTRKENLEKMNNRGRSLSAVPFVPTSSLPKYSRYSDEDEEQKPHEHPILNYNELNYLAARAVRAKICGDVKLASKIENDLEIAKREKQEFELSGSRMIDTPREEVISFLIDRYLASESHKPSILDRQGRVVYVDPLKTKYSDYGQASLQYMFEREKLTSVDDQLKMYVDVASAVQMDEAANVPDEMGDMAAKIEARISHYPKQQKDIQKTIQDYKKRAVALDRCLFCLDKPGLLKHTVVGKGKEVYLCTPSYRSLVDGHCFIVPYNHVSSTLLLDENVYSELQVFKRGLVKQFSDQNKRVIFMETSVNHRFYPHAVIECIPVFADIWELAPLYFKKAIEESEQEWSLNKKLIDLSKADIQHAVPKELPFFSVEFGNNCGFAHVIECDRKFSRQFGKEIVGGMLELDFHDLRNETEDSTDEICQKVLKFAEIWWKYKDCFKC